MELTKQNEDKIIKLSKSLIKNKENLFFQNVFSKFSPSDQLKILELVQKNSRSFINDLRTMQSKGEIITELVKLVKLFLQQNNEQDFQFLIAVYLYTTYMRNEDIPFEDRTITNIFDKMLNMLNTEKLTINNKYFINILHEYTKKLAYSVSKSKDYNNIRNSISYKKYEYLVSLYLDEVNIEQLLEDGFVNCLVECDNAINSEIIKTKLRSKISEPITFEFFLENINNNIPIAENEKDAFFKTLIMYRIQNEIIPEEICIYVNRFFANDKKFLRLVNIDYSRHYLKDNNIENAVIFYDEFLKTPGLARNNCFVLKNVYLSRDMFHEATHVIQHSNADENFIGYNYSLLKDLITNKNINYDDYTRNHTSWLFEIDADYKGEKQLFLAERKIGTYDEESKAREEYLEIEFRRRLSESHNVTINGNVLNKFELFDTILMNNPNIMELHPIFKIEYTPNGSKKNIIQILQSLENELSSNRRTEEEIISIANCIFNDSYTITDPMIEVQILGDFISNSNNKTIIEIKNNLMNRLQLMINKNVIETQDSYGSGFHKR